MTIKRMQFLQQLMDFVGLEGRLHLEWISSAEAQKFVDVVTRFTEKIRRLGPNPIQSLPKAQLLLKPKAVPVPTAKTVRPEEKPSRPAKQPARNL
jgi:F420-non-reducing hydrogenase iron-sulfur subunit